MAGLILNYKIIKELADLFNLDEVTEFIHHALNREVTQHWLANNDTIYMLPTQAGGTAQFHAIEYIVEHTSHDGSFTVNDSVNNFATQVESILSLGNQDSIVSQAQPLNAIVSNTIFNPNAVPTLDFEAEARFTNGSRRGRGGGTSRNDRPEVVEQTVNAQEDGQPVSGQLEVNDANTTDTHTFELDEGPSEGSVVVNTDGSFSFDPGNDFQDLGEGQTRTVTFTVQATDSAGMRNSISVPATISVVVAGVNDVALALDDTFEVLENELVIDVERGVLWNDTDVDGDSLQAELISGPENGTLVFNSDGSFTYNYSGNGATQDSFTYLVNDGFSDSNVATVSFEITPPPEPEPDPDPEPDPPPPDPEPDPPPPDPDPPPEEPTTGLTINLIDIGGAAPGTLAGDAFAVAANFWESLFLDSITVNLNVGFSSLGPGILGSTGSAKAVVDYTTLYAALWLDQTSEADSTAVSSLQTSSSVTFYANDPDGNYYLDADGSANNSMFYVNTANLKALDLINDDTIVDGQVRFSSNFSFDFDSSDGITDGTFDFVSIAVHEIGHALGFVSGVDVVDYYSGQGPASWVTSFDPYAIFNTLDLFRFSDDSVALGLGVPDVGYEDRGQYFSIDGGVTPVATFSTGVYNGDGRQASHWEDNLDHGILDPTFSRGEIGTITDNELLAFDVIGYDLVEGASETSLQATLTELDLASPSNLAQDALAIKSNESVNGSAFIVNNPFFGDDLQVTLSDDAMLS